MLVRVLNFVSGIAVSAILCSSLLAQCTGQLDQRSGGAGGILVSDLKISGTKTLSTEQLHRIARAIVGFCFNEDNDELMERLRNEFQNRGYFMVEVKSLDIKVVDPLISPKPVVLEFDAVEGGRYKTGIITFIDNHAFTSSQLRDAFPIKTGQWFERNSIGKGLERLGDLYSTSGHLDYYAEPDIQVAAGNKMNLKVTIHEGSQYRMGKLEVFAPKEVTEKIATQWDLKPGRVFDLSYAQKFVEDHRQLFPPSFQSDHIQHARNCRDLTVDVRIPIDSLDPRSHTPFPESGCETEKELSRTNRTRTNGVATPTILLFSASQSKSQPGHRPAR
jgi:hypothetical protein